MTPPASGSRLARSAGLTGIATLTSRILGLARETVLAALFGAGNDMDAFVVAFRVPNLVRDLFAEGAMSAAFVPAFTRRLTLAGKAEAWRLGNNVLNMLIAITGGLVIVAIVFAEPIVVAFAGRFGEVPGKLELTVALTRVTLPFLTMVAVAAALMGMLNSLHHYFIPSLSPAMFNLATIACAFALAPLMPALGWPPIMAVAMGAILGGLLQALVQWPSLHREGFRYQPVLDPREPGMREILALLGPGTIGLAATQVNLFVSTLLATTQGTGAVSWLTYAFRVMYLPIGLFGVSIGTAVLPAVSRHTAAADDAAVRRTAAQGLAMMVVLNVPATVGLLVLADPIVTLLFERGRFRPEDTAMTAAALRLYAIGLVGYAAVRIVSPIFYAIRQSRVPVIVSTCSIALNILTSVALVPVLGFRGLALGTSLATIANGGLLVALLRRRLNGIDGARLSSTCIKTVAASILMAVAAIAIERGLFAVWPRMSLGAQVLRLGATIAGGLVVLAVAGKLLRIREFDDLLALATRRGSTVAPPDATNLK